MDPNKDFVCVCSVNVYVCAFVAQAVYFCRTDMFVSLTDLPSAPGAVVAIRNTASSVVVSWGKSKDVKHLVGYYVETSVEGSNVWVPCNNKPVKCTRYHQSHWHAARLDGLLLSSVAI